MNPSRTLDQLWLQWMDIFRDSLWWNPFVGSAALALLIVIGWAAARWLVRLPLKKPRHKA